MLKTLMICRLPLQLLLLLFLAYTTRGVSSLESSSLASTITTATTQITTTRRTYPIVVSTIIQRSRSDWHQNDWIDKMKQLNVLGTKWLLKKRNSTTTNDNDEEGIQIHILLHNDHDHQILKNLLGDSTNTEIVVHSHDDDDGDDNKEEEQQGIHHQQQQQQQHHRNLQQQEQYETINKGRYKCYRTVEGTFATMQDLAMNHATLVTSFDIGQSYEQTQQETMGYPIRALRITGPSSSDNDEDDEEEDDTSVTAGVFRKKMMMKHMMQKKKRKMKQKKAPVLITAGVHSREYAPVELLTRFAEKLVTLYGKDADITWILDRTELHLVPLVNPDGRKIAEMDRDITWRKNTNPDGCDGNTYGVDLNRQYPFAWGDDSGSSDDPCSNQFRGPEALSEPESWALAQYAASIFPKEQMRGETYQESFTSQDTACNKNSVGVYIDIHSYGGQVYYPWGYADIISPNNEGVRSMATKLASFGGYGLWGPGQPDFLYPVSGDSTDFMYGHHCVSSFGFEIGTEFYEACDSFEDVVVDNIIPALILAAKVASAPFAIVKGPDVLEMMATVKGGGSASKVKVTATVSDSARATAYDVIGDTGLQNIKSVCIYIDVHPYDATKPCIKMIPVDGSFDSTTEAVRANIDNLAPGMHTVFIEARDALGYKGPVSALFVEIPEV